MNRLATFKKKFLPSSHLSERRKDREGKGEESNQGRSEFDHDVELANEAKGIFYLESINDHIRNYNTLN